jgi:hypothetical protein
VRLTLAMLAAVLLAHCATAIHHDLQAVPVTSTPSGADVTLDCGRGATRIGTTPLTLMLHRRDSHCSATIVKSGWGAARVDFHRVPSAAALSDVAAALIIGGVVANSNVDFSASNGTSTGGTVNVSASGSGSVPPAAIAGVFLSGALLVDVASGALFAQVPRRVDVTLQPRR